MSRITKDEIERMLALDKERAELESRARSLKSEVDQLVAKAEADLESTGKQQCQRGGYVLRFVEVARRVRWKDELIKLAGAETAERIAKGVGTRRKVQVGPR